MEHHAIVGLGYRVINESAHFVTIDRDPGDPCARVDLKELETLEALGYRFLHVETYPRAQHIRQPVFLLRKPA